MYQERSGQSSFWGDPLYERIIPKDHFLKRLNDLIEFKKVNEMVKDLYSKDMGRPCYEPAMLFKMIYLQFMFNISDRDIEEQVRYNMVYKWFIGLSAEELPPDHSTLSVFRERLGADRFLEIFNWVVKEARGKGFINNRLHIIDATAMAAKADIIKFSGVKNGEMDERRDKDDKSGGYPSHPDQDARWGCKRKRESFFGYKMHAGMDADSEMITKVTVTPGNTADIVETFNIKDEKAETVVGDKGYDSFYVQYTLRQKGIKSLIYRRMHKGRIESKKVRERGWIERKFSECKGCHGLRMARYWGLIKLKIQGYMTAIVVNLKQMLKLATAPPKWLACSSGH